MKQKEEKHRKERAQRKRNDHLWSLLKRLTFITPQTTWDEVLEQVKESSVMKAFEGGFEDEPAKIFEQYQQFLKVSLFFWMQELTFSNQQPQ